MNEKASFFSKGQGRSHIISDFLVCHLPGPYFSSSESEFMMTSKVYLNLLDDSGIHYVQYSATVGINLGHYVYFDDKRRNTMDMILKPSSITLGRIPQRSLV